MKKKIILLFRQGAYCKALYMLLCILGCSFALHAQTRVSGTVVDANGEAVVGVNVIEKGTANGTITGLDGEFSLNVQANAILQVSFIGYIKQEVAVGNQTKLNIVLQEDSQVLNEVVVTALGIKREAKTLGYAMATIKADDLIKTGTPNFASSLYGKASGVSIQSAPGGAGTAVSINVRGLSSITGNNQPLLIVDGVPVRNGNANTAGYWTDQRINSNGLVDINTEDIESLSILKGASATALYGSEAANGVIMITTKSGQRGGGYSIDVNATLSQDYVAYMPEFQTVFGPGSNVRGRSGAYQLDSGGFYERNGQKSIEATTQQFGPKYDGSQVLYWDGQMRAYNAVESNPWDAIFRTAFNQTYNVGITHGGENSNTRFSYTFVDNLPNQYNSSYKKNNFNMSGSFSLGKNLNVAYTANYMREEIQNRAYRISRMTNNFNGMFGTFDDLALFREKYVTSLGYKNIVAGGETITPDESFAFSPSMMTGLGDEYLWHILGKERYETNNRLLASVTPTWTIADGLSLRGRIATDFTSNTYESNEHSERPLMYGASGYYGLTNRRDEIYYGDIMLQFRRALTDLIEINANAGWQGRAETMFSSTVGTNGGLSVENWFNLASSTNKADASMGKSQLLKTALFGAVGASFANAVYLEGTLRQEISSTLAPGNNSFVYPSANLSYVYTDMFRDALPRWYDFGKARLSYGVVGNAPDAYRANEVYTQGLASTYIYNITQSSLGNETIRPETKYEWEFGLESKFFGDRLGVEVSYYTSTIKDQILPATLPTSSGGSSILLNIGELANQGVELSLYGTPVQTKDFSWNLSLNAAWNRNKVVKLMEGLPYRLDSNLDNAVEVRSYVGEPMGDIYAYAPKEVEVNGVMQKEVDANGMYVMDFSAMKKVGNAMPEMTGGLGTTFRYKSLSLSALIDFRIGGMVVNTPYQYMMGRGSLVESLPFRDAEHGGLTYTLEQGGKTYTYDNGMILDGVRNNGAGGYVKNDIVVPSDYYYNESYNWGGYGYVDYSHSIFENTYAKLRELTFGYSLPKSVSSKFACKNLTVSIFGRNLFYFHKNLPAFDAEATDGTSWVSQTSIGGSTATTRSFGFSLRANF